MIKLTTFIFTTAFTSFGICYGQEYTVQVKLVNEKHDPLQFVSVALLDSNQVKVKQDITDSLGVIQFKQTAGTYVLQVSNFNKLLLNKEIDISKDIDLGLVSVDNSQLLEAVVINKSVKVFERKIDRLVFNVQNSIASQGMNGLDVLKNTPMLRVQNEQVSIIGKSGVMIMINDRIINLSDTELVNYIQGLRSDDIARVEVITTPSAKYDAAGSSGIINIVLKTKSKQGWSGSVSSAYARKSKNGVLNNAALNFQSEKINTSIKLRQHDRRKLSYEKGDIIYSGTSFSNWDDRVDRNYGLGANISLDYSISKKSKAGVVYDYGQTDIDNRVENRAEYFTGGRSDSLLQTMSTHRYSTPTHVVSGYYDLKLDSLGKKVSFVGNYLSTNSDNKINFDTHTSQSSGASIYRNISKSEYSVLSGQLDAVLPNRWFNLEVGGKYTLFRNKSNIALFRSINPGEVLEYGNSFDYTEDNYAGYFTGSKDFGEKWSAKAGLRYEYSVVDGRSGDNGTNKMDYGKFFPSIYLTYKPNDDNIFSINYSKRINRPSFRALNPNRIYLNPLSFVEGNPALRYSITNNLELSYTFKNKLSLVLYGQQSKDNSGQIIYFENGTRIVRFENYFDNSDLGLNVYYNDVFFKTWEFVFSSNAYYTKAESNLPIVVGQSSLAFYYTVNNTIALNKEKSLHLLLNFWHVLPYSMANSKIKGSYDFSPGVKWALLDKKLMLSAVVSDVFKADRGRGYSIYKDYRTTFDNYYDARTFTVSAVYNFGSTKVKGPSRNIKFDDKNRAN